MRGVFFFILLFSQGISIAFCQSLDQSFLNSLGYEKLLDVFNAHEGDSLAQSQIAYTYLNRAKKEKDTVKIARGYDRLARSFSAKTNLIYVDSLIDYTKDWNHITYPAMGYIMKGFEYSKLRNIPNTVKNYLIVDSIATLTNNLDFKTYVLDRLIFEYNSWWDSEKALELQKERHKIITSDKYKMSLIDATRDEKQVDLENIYIARKVLSYENFVVCYLFNENYDLTNYYLEKINNELSSYDGYLKDRFILWSLDAKMEVEYHLQNYDRTLKISDSILDIIDKDEKPYYYKNLNLFKGLTYLKFNDNEKALYFLSKADSIYNIDDWLSIPRYDKMLFIGLLEIHKDLNHKDKQIEYLDKLIYLDSISRKNYQYFVPQMIKTFDTSKLLLEKETIIESLRNNNRKSNTFLYLSLVVLFVILISAIYFYRRQKLFKNRFLALLEGKQQASKNEISQKGTLVGISIDIVNDIETKLSRFENNKLYLKNDVSLHNLSKKLETNSNYLSRVLNSKNGMSFSQYLNELRVNYALEEIKNNPVFKKYSINAIAKECGYNSGASFSRVFYKITGISPSYYIKQLDKVNSEALKKQ